MTASVTYVLSSLLWGFAGLFIGYLAGAVSTAYHFRKQLAEEGVMPSGTPVRTDKVVGAIVIVMSMVSVIVSAISTHQQSEQVTCQSAFNAVFAAALDQRSDAATKERQAQRVLLTTPYTTPTDWAASKDQYLEALDQADEQRNENPLPDRPAC